VLAITDWSALGAIATAAIVSVTIAGGAATRSQRWRQERRARTRGQDIVRIAVFGRPAEGGLEATPGLLHTQAETSARLHEVAGEVAALRADVDGLLTGVGQLLERTQPNGGGSLKDQLDRQDAMLGAITTHLGMPDAAR